MLAHCLQRWPNIKLALGRRLVFAGIWSCAGEQSPAHMSENAHQVKLNDVAPSVTSAQP